MAANRTRKNLYKLYLSDDEEYILEEKWKLSGLKSRAAFIRNLIIYGYVYEVDYSHLHEYSKEISRIGNNINQLVRLCQKTGNIYENDIREIKELMEKIWHTHESTLSKQPHINQ